MVLDTESGEESEEEYLLGFHTVEVFHVSQTEGEPLPEFTRTEGDASMLIPAVERVIASAGIRLAYETRLGWGTNGSTDGSTIVVRHDLPSADRFRCLAHELAHCLLGHTGRRTFTPTHVRETEAEAAAFVVCHAFGLDALDRSRDYIHLWDGDRETLMYSLNAIQRTVDLMGLSGMMRKRI